MPEWDNLVFDYVDHNELFFWLRGNQIYDEGNRTLPPPPEIDEDGELNYGHQRDYWRRRNRHYAQHDIVGLSSHYFYDPDGNRRSKGKLLAQRTSNDNNWSYQSANIFIDPCVWGNARPMQIIFPVEYDPWYGKHIGELRFRLSPLPDRQRGIEGRIRAYHVPQKIFLGAMQHGFNAGYDGEGNLNTTKMGNPYLGDIRTPFSYQGPGQDSYVDNVYSGSRSHFGKGGMSGQVQVLELYENGSKVDEREFWFQQFDLRLSIYQPDSTTGRAKVFFGSLDQCSTFGIFHEASTSFLQHDELGNLGCAFPSYEVIRDYSWKNEQWRILGADYIQRTNDTTGTPTQWEPGHVHSSFHTWETENGIYRDYLKNGYYGRIAIFVTPIQYSFENEIKSIGTQGNTTGDLFYSIKNSGSSLGLPYGDVPYWRYGNDMTSSGSFALFTPTYLYNILNSERLASYQQIMVTHAGGQYPNESSDWLNYWAGEREDQQRPRHPSIAWNSDPGEYNMKDFIKRSLWASPKDYSDTHAPALGDKNLKADKVSCKLTIDPFLLNKSSGTPSLYYENISWTDATSNAQMPVGTTDDALVGRFIGPHSSVGDTFYDPWQTDRNRITGVLPNAQLAPGAFYGQRVFVTRYVTRSDIGNHWRWGHGELVLLSGLFMWDGTNWIRVGLDHGGDEGPQGYSIDGYLSATYNSSRVTSVGRFTFNALNNRWLSFENKTAEHYGPSRTLAQGLYAHDKIYEAEHIFSDKSGFTHFLPNHSQIKKNINTGVYWGPEWGDKESLPNGVLYRDTLHKGKDIYTSESAQAEFAFEDLDSYTTSDWNTPGPWEWTLYHRVRRVTNSSGTILDVLNEKLAAGDLTNPARWTVDHINPEAGQGINPIEIVSWEMHAPSAYSFKKQGYLLRTQAFAHISKDSPSNDWNPHFRSTALANETLPQRYGPDQNDIDRDSETAYEKNTDGNLKHIHAYKFDKEQYENGESSINWLRDNPPLCVPFADGSTKWGFKIYLDCEEYAENINGYGGQVYTNQTKTLRHYSETFTTILHPKSLIDQLGVLGTGNFEDQYGVKHTMAQLDNPASIENQLMTSTRIGVHVWVYLNEARTREFTQSKIIDVNFPIRADNYQVTGREPAQQQADMHATLVREWSYDPTRAREQWLNEGSVCLAHIQHIPTRYHRSLEAVEMNTANEELLAAFQPIGHSPEYRGWELPTIFNDEDDSGHRRINYGAQYWNYNRGDKDDFNFMTRANASSPGSITLRLD